MNLTGLLRQFGRGFEKAVGLAAKGFALITSLAVLIMIVVGGADVLGTKLLNKPVPATFELTELLMVAIVFGGLAYAQLERRHIRVEFLLNRISPKGRGLLNLIAVLFGFTFFLILTWRASSYFWQSWMDQERGTSMARFPIYPSKFVMLTGSALMTLQLLIDIVRSVRGLWREFVSPSM